MSPLVVPPGVHVLLVGGQVAVGAGGWVGGGCMGVGTGGTGYRVGTGLA